MFIRATILLSCFYTSFAYSQPSDSLSLRQRYEHETIYLQGKYYVKGDQFTRTKFTTIGKEFINSKEAYSEFSLSTKDHQKASRSFQLALGLYVGGVFLLANKQEGAIVPLVGSLVAFGYGLHYNTRSGKRFQHALWLRNGEVLLNGNLDDASLRARYENETIHWSKGRYIKGNQRISTRHHQFEQEFARSNDGLDEWSLAQKEYHRSRPFTLLAVGMIISSFVLYSHHEKNAAAITYFGAIVPLAFSIHIQSKSQKHLQKAIWLRNRDVLVNAP